MKISQTPWIDDQHPFVIVITHKTGQAVVAVLALCAILVYVAALYIFRAYDGLSISTIMPGVVDHIDDDSPAIQAGIRVGDKIIVIDGLPVDRWLRQPRFKPGTSPGQELIYLVLRGREPLSILVKIGSLMDQWALISPLLGVIFLALIFWGFGLILSLFSTSTDVQNRLVGITWILVGVVIAASGPGIQTHFWGANLVSKITWSLVSCTNLISHLYFPSPSFSARFRKNLITISAVGSVLLSLLVVLEEWVFWPNNWSFFYGIPTSVLIYVWFFISVLFSVTLLVRHRLLSQSAEIKRQTGILLWGTIFSLCPFVFLTIIPTLLSGSGQGILEGAYTAQFIALLPLTYAYVINQYQLFEIDFVFSRAIILFVLAMLVALFSFIVLWLITYFFHLPPELPPLGMLLLVAVAMLSVPVQKQIGIQVDRVLYGQYYDHESVISNISTHLIQALDRPTLVTLLTQSLSVQMGILQSSLLLSDDGELRSQAPTDAFNIGHDDEFCQFLLQNSRPVRIQNLSTETLRRWAPFRWAQIFSPIVFQNHLYGILILGNRSSGNLYSERDLRIISTVIHQAAIACANIQLVETLRGLTCQLVQTEEAERKALAHELHDTVLQDLFFIKQRLARQAPELIEPMDHVIAILRQTIKTQRPPLLDRGLPLALEGLVSDLQSLAREQGARIFYQNHLPDGINPLDDTATVIYRIAREALANAIKHSRATRITVLLQINSDKVLCLSIKDNGTGMLKTTSQTRETHYGMVGMHERANMIGAKLQISSQPEMGAEVLLMIPMR